MRKEIKALKNHTRLQTHLLNENLLLRGKVIGFSLGPSNAQIADRYRAAVEEFEEVDASQ